MNYLKLKGDNNFLCLCCLAVVGYLIYLVLYNRPILEGTSCGPDKPVPVEGMANRKGQKLRKMMMEDARHDVKEIFAAFPGCFNEKPQVDKKKRRNKKRRSRFFDKYNFGDTDEEDDVETDEEDSLDEMKDKDKGFQKKSLATARAEKAAATQAYGRNPFSSSAKERFTKAKRELKAAELAARTDENVQKKR